jgi:hypothetical protein
MELYDMLALALLRLAMSLDDILNIHDLLLHYTVLYTISTSVCV